MTKDCVICGGDEASGEILIEAPCQLHWVCADDIASFFENATNNESLYPPKCCGHIFLLDEYEDHVPFEIQWAFQKKAQGEYSVLAKYRIYCASPTCSEFLNPSTHVKDPVNGIVYALCRSDSCRRVTCMSCKGLINGLDSHSCDHSDDFKKFKQTATEKGFQDCPVCASTIELAEACNHITCGCGAQFCYICGKEWPGVHGCPKYGPAVYDEDGYNQEGYHRKTGLNRDGNTRRQQDRLNAVEDSGDDDDEGDEDDEDDEDNGEDEERNQADWHILQHVEPRLRATITALPRETREAFLINLQIQLFEEHGITFHVREEEDEVNGDGEENEDEIDQDDETDVESNNNGQNSAEQSNSPEQNAQGGMDEDPFGQEPGLYTPPIIGNRILSPFPFPSTEAQVLANMQAAADAGLPVRRVPPSDFHFNPLDTDIQWVDNAGSSSRLQPQGLQAAVSMDVDPAGEERPLWKGPPGGWPDDEEL